MLPDTVVDDAPTPPVPSSNPEKCGLQRNQAGSARAVG
jgi:hypothetical protein